MKITDVNQIPVEMYRILFEQVSDAVFVLDSYGRIRIVNQRACDYLGYTREELFALTPLQIMAPEFIESFPERLRHIHQMGEATFELEHLHRDGTRIPVEMHSRMVALGEETLLLTVCRDISARRQRELEYRSIIQAAGDGYWAVRVADARILDVNDTFCAMVGYTREELLSMSIADLEVDESAEETARHIQQIVETGHDLFETRHRHKDGRILQFEISVSYAPINGGVIFVFTRDISRRKQQEEDLRLAAMIFDASTASIVATDANNKIVTANAAFTRSSGYALHEVLGRDPRFLQSGRQDKVFYQRMWQALERDGSWEGEWWNRRKNGELYAEHVVLNVVQDAEGGVYRHVKISTDITAKKQLNEILLRQARYDMVTRLPNRRFFYAQLSAALRRCQSEGKKLAVYFIDLDGFKQVNDVHGHDVGDQLLLAVAQRISGCVRSSDVVARMGGDEFTVMVSGVNERSRIDAIARKILEVLSGSFRVDVLDVGISASIGIAIYPDDAGEMEALMKKSDEAMYRAKQNGKNSVFYSSDSV